MNWDQDKLEELNWDLRDEEPNLAMKYDAAFRNRRHQLDANEIADLEAAIDYKEQDLKAMRQQLKLLKKNYLANYG